MISVVLDRRTFGASSFDDAVPLVEHLPLFDALEKEWDSDACLAPYVVVFPEEVEGALPFGDAWVIPHPRLKKGIEKEIRAAGGEVVSTALVIDWDTPRHEPWSGADEVSRFFDSILRLKGPCADWSALYTTRKGARIIYVPEKAIVVEEAEAVHRGLLAEIRAEGINVKKADECGDWTHLFLLPRVLRDGGRSEQDPFFDLSQRPKTYFDISKVRPILGREALTVDSDYGPAPDTQDAKALVDGTSWAIQAKVRLKGHPSYDVIWGNKKIADDHQGERRSAIHRLAGDAVAALFPLPGTSPELIFGLLVDAVLALTPDAKCPFDKELWTSICKCWALDSAKVVTQVEVQRSTLGRVVDGMRQWDSTLPKDDAEAQAVASSRLIIATPSRTYHVMGPDGFVDVMPLAKDHISMRIRALGMNAVIPLQEDDGHGKAKQLSAQTLIDRFGTLIRRIEGAVGGLKSHIRRIGEDDATLVLRLFKLRDDITPKHDLEVESWLRALVGPEHYADVCRWIGYALDFQAGPICALSIVGPPGCGKKLLAQGLAECVTGELYADARELERFQTLIELTPFLVINEGFPKGEHGAKSPADSFRHMVGGDAQITEEKFAPKKVLRNPIRMIFTANNLDVVATLTAGKDLSPEDWQALSQRLMHIDAPANSGDWLRARGGLRHTSQKGRRWIRGDDGSKSDYIVARHFLHLYESRPPVPAGNRLLVEGNAGAELMHRLRYRSGAAPDVIETLVRMIELFGRSPQMTGIIVGESSIVVTIDGVVQEHRKTIGRDTRRSISATQVASVLRSVRTNRNPEIRPIKVRGEKAQTSRWYELDPRVLLREAEEHGWQSERLVQVAAKAPRTVSLDDRTVKEVERLLRK